MGFSDTTKKIASNTTYQLIGKVVSMLITVFATVVITRVYGREGYGAFSLMQTFPALFFIIVDFGINAISVKELAHNWDKAGKYLANILVIRSLMSLLLIAFLSVVLLFLPYDSSLKTGIFLSLFLILTQALYATTNIFFQTRLKYNFSMVGYLAGYSLILGLVITLAHLRSDVMWVSFGYVLGGLVTFLVNCLYLKKLGIPCGLELDRKLWKHLFVQSLPLGLMFVFSQINFKADSIALSLLRVPAKYGLNNTETVAVYNLPYKVFEVSLVVPTFFMNSVYPVLVKRMHEGKDALLKLFEKVILTLVGLGILCSIFGVLLAPFAIRILGGEAFVQSIFVLRILLLGVGIFYLTQPLSWLVITLGKQRYLPWIYMIGAFFDVGANILVIPRYSFYGSSIITIISEFLILLMLLFAARKAWKLKYAS